MHTSRHTRKNSSFSTQDEHLVLLGLEALTTVPKLRYATRSTSGCDLLLSELALAGCAQDRIEPRFSQLDTTSLSLHGDDVPESDTHAIGLTHGYAKEQRPDLKQAV